MAHRLVAVHKRNKQLCRLNRAPVIAAVIGALSIGVSTHDTPKLTHALGDHITNRAVVPLGSPYLRAALGMGLAQRMKQQRANLTAPQVTALMYCEMTMSCVGEVGSPETELTQAQNIIKAMLRATPPTQADVKTTFTKLWEKIEQYDSELNFEVESIDGLTDRFPQITGRFINQRKYFALASGAHAFDPNCIQPESLRLVWAELQEAAGSPVNMEITEENRAAMNIDYDSFVTNWKQASLPELCAYHEAFASAHRTQMERHLIHALFTCLAHLSKGQNKTSSWVENLFKRVQENMVGLPDLEYAVVVEFSKMHAGSKLTNEAIFAALAASFKCLEDTPAASLCWIIEQAAASNITGAHTVADIVSKMLYFPLDNITRSTVPKPQFASLVLLAMHIMVNRFGSLAGPPVPVKEYADLAHLALVIYKKGARQNERNTLTEYADIISKPESLKFSAIKLESQ
ncbi:uncharacterized protein [Maniola hyperantus]|uniref:uncharacterized protein n=1 Tax=Aphantopus hyperantus TaxID=2795564 RepID=UPI003747F594